MQNYGQQHRGKPEYRVICQQLILFRLCHDGGLVEFDSALFFRRLRTSYWTNVSLLFQANQIGNSKPLRYSSLSNLFASAAAAPVNVSDVGSKLN